MTGQLKLRIQEDIKTAMRAKERELLSTIRSLIAAIKQREIDDRVTLDDAAITKVIEKMIKQRYDSIVRYKAGSRYDLVNKEQREINLLQKYLPKALSEAEIEKIVNQAIERASITSVKDIGKVMVALKKELEGQRVDMSLVNAKVKERLAYKNT